MQIRLVVIYVIGDTPNYRCALPPNGSAEYWIPQVEKNGHFEYDKCSMYVDPSIDNMTVPCQYGYWYDPESGYDSTISMQVSKLHYVIMTLRTGKAKK